MSGRRSARSRRPRRRKRGRMPQATIARRIPKVHLHCHLEGTLRGATFVELAGRHGVPLRYRPQRDPSDRPLADEAAEPADPADPYRFSDFREFLMMFAAVSRSLRDPEDYARLAREFVEDSLAQRVVYGELFVSPSVWTFFNPALDVRATMSVVAAELRAARPRATFKLLPDLTRNFGAERAMQTARTVAAMTDLDIVGVSLGGDEARFPASLFADVFAYARAEGLRCVAHAGEADGPQSVRDAVELLGAERIGHGIAALRDDAVGRTARGAADRARSLSDVERAHGSGARRASGTVRRSRPARMRGNDRLRRSHALRYLDRGASTRWSKASPGQPRSSATCVTRSCQLRRAPSEKAAMQSRARRGARGDFRRRRK